MIRYELSRRKGTDMTNLYRAEPTLARINRNPIAPAGAISNPLFQGWGPKF